MTLKAPLEKSADGDLLAQIIGCTANRPMELEAKGLTGAALVELGALVRRRRWRCCQRFDLCGEGLRRQIVDARVRPHRVEVPPPRLVRRPAGRAPR